MKISFDKTNIDELKKIMHETCYPHDATLEAFEYFPENKTLKFKWSNPYYNNKAEFTLYDVEVLLEITGHFPGGGERDDVSLIYMSVEDDYSFLQSIIKHTGLTTDAEHINNAIYFLIQMFTSREIHIAFGRGDLEVETLNKDNS